MARRSRASASAGSEPRSRSKAARKKEGHIPRPLNAWMIFRKEFCAKKQVQYAALPPKQRQQRHLSGEASIAWKHISPAEFDDYKYRAEMEKEEHRRKYPNYKYQPKRKPKVDAEAPSPEPPKIRAPEKKGLVVEMYTPPTTVTCPEPPTVGTSRDGRKLRYDLRYPSSKFQPKRKFKDDAEASSPEPPKSRAPRKELVVEMYTPPTTVTCPESPAVGGPRDESELVYGPTPSADSEVLKVEYPDSELQDVFYDQGYPATNSYPSDEVVLFPVEKMYRMPASGPSSVNHLQVASTESHVAWIEPYVSTNSAGVENSCVQLAASSSLEIEHEVEEIERLYVQYDQPDSD